MTFLLVCAAAISLISSRCWFLQQFELHRQPPPLSLTDKIKEYEAFEEMAIQLIVLSASSPSDQSERLGQFYKDFPHPVSNK
jgi:hypothetical protein